MPRLLIEIVSYLATSSFLVWIMFHKEEPKDWSLPDFMDEAAYPSVSCLWPLHQCLYHSQCLMANTIQYTHPGLIQWTSHYHTVRLPISKPLTKCLPIFCPAHTTDSCMTKIHSASAFHGTYHLVQQLS